MQPNNYDTPFDGTSISTSKSILSTSTTPGNLEQAAVPPVFASKDHSTIATRNNDNSGETADEWPWPGRAFMLTRRILHWYSRLRSEFAQGVCLVLGGLPMLLFALVEGVLLLAWIVCAVALCPIFCITMFLTMCQPESQNADPLTDAVWFAWLLTHAPIILLMCVTCDQATLNEFRSSRNKQ